MSPDSKTVYVPIVKTKRGELRALRKLKLNNDWDVVPLVDIHRISKYPENKIKDTLDVHLRKIAANLMSYWAHPAFIDFSTIDLEARTPNGEHPLEFFFKHDTHHCWIPVIGLDRDQDYLKAAQDVIATGTDLCFRLLEEDLEDVDATRSFMTEIMDMSNVDESRCHVIMDLKYIVSNELYSKKSTAVKFINSFTNITDFKTLALASSAFPESLAGNKNSVYRIPRLDLQLWRSVINEQLARKPIFSDYGVINPNTPDLNPQAIDPSAKIRYTSNKDWIIVKGASVRKGKKYAQFIELASALIAHAEFKGKNFSWGDNFIHECATDQKKKGNLEQWVKVDTNHHITFVVDQISKIVV